MVVNLTTFFKRRQGCRQGAPSLPPIAANQTKNPYPKPLKHSNWMKERTCFEDVLTI